MSVPDQSHINRVRDALWQRSGGGASVMIGSGFSRNARKSQPDANGPLTWREVAKAVYDKLYSQGGDSDLGTTTSDFLRLAQEYEAAFGRGDLHLFLRELIRDEDFVPGSLHTRLLSLPWRDVFTTNWDTLLEQARTSVLGRAYSIVGNMDEIPLANRPRIVKLHGSFPAQFPLIFTEEDYRTYPIKFAPFVNTVQQAMMETVFCLIGFSGDDPNFLQWSGWVRDNLGDAAPKIYLAGWLNLSSHRRRMLEDRKVVPIDLALHPKAGGWPDHLRHQYATEWILHTLEYGQPYDISEWPLQRSWQRRSVQEIIQPVEEVVSGEPKKEKEPNEQSSVQDILNVWTHNRTVYPGWLAVPTVMGMSWQTGLWESRILNELPDLTTVERLKAIRELMWRREILLDPISSGLEDAAQEVLKLIDCQNRTIDGIVDPEIEWTSIREAWRTVALSLVTAARYRLDQDVFEQRANALSPFLQDDSVVSHRIHHERCLWAMYSMDFESLDGLLKDWQTENCDPVWMMRKAALLFEMGEPDEARELSKHALSIIREIPTSDLSLASPSREGWALWFLLDNNSQVRKRWDELAPLKCNAFAEVRFIKEVIEYNSGTEEAPSFELGTRQGSNFHWSREGSERRVAAYRAIRLSEVVGLPPAINHLNVATDILKLAAESLAVSYPEIAIRLVLRILKYDGDETLMRVLSRTRVASLSANSARVLAEICNSVIKYVLPRIVGTDARGYSPVFWIERMRVAMEALSRLVLRQESEKVEAIFNNALEYYRNDYVARHPWLEKSVRNLLDRSWEALPEERRAIRALDLLSAPIVGLDNFEAGSSNYPDPGYLLQNTLLPPTRTRDNESHWQEIVSLLVRGLRTGGEARKRASLRVVYVELEGEGLLTEAEAVEVSQALWNDKYTPSNDLPSGTLLLDWAFILLPAPESGLGAQRFRLKWLTASNVLEENTPSLDDILWQVGTAIFGLEEHGRSLDLSESERSYLIEVIEQWSETPVPIQNSPLMGSFESIDRVLVSLAPILTEIQIPVSVGEKLYQKVQVLNESGFFGFGLIAGLVKALQNHFDELVSMMRMGLVADKVEVAEDAAVGLYDWLTISAKVASQIQPPPSDLVREVGIMIATRRRRALGQALKIAKWVFDEGNDAQKEIICDLALQGLGYLIEELRYDREHEQEDDVPFLRWHCAHLALAMEKYGLGDDPVIARWSENIENDPLPEVRFARPAFRHQSNHPMEN